MPSRRHHAKSRNGCVQCKKSHVKCDEAYPVCGYCVRRDMRCSLMTTRGTDGSPARTRRPQTTISSVSSGHSQGPARSSVEASGYSTEATLVPSHREDRNDAHTQPPGQGQSSRRGKYPNALSPHLSVQHESTGYASSQASPLAPEYRSRTPVNVPPGAAIQPKSLSLRGLEGFLIHHYITFTCHTFCNSDPEVSIWRHVITHEAWIHDFLLEGLLGLTALHCSSFYPEYKADWSEIAIEYQNRSLENFGKIIHNITPEQCHAAFGFTILIMFVTFAMSRPNSNDPVEHFLIARRRMQGLSTVATRHLGEISKGGFAHFCLPAEERPPSNIVNPPGDDVKDAIDKIYTLSEASANHKAYYTAITTMQSGVKRFSLSIAGWSQITLDDEFDALLNDHDPMALLIVAYHGVLLHYMDLDGRWWAKGIGKLYVDSMTKVLLESNPPDALHEAAGWARAHVGLEN